MAQHQVFLQGHKLCPLKNVECAKVIALSVQPGAKEIFSLLRNLPALRTEIPGVVIVQRCNLFPLSMK